MCQPVCIHTCLSVHQYVHEPFQINPVFTSEDQWECEDMTWWLNAPLYFLQAGIIRQFTCLLLFCNMLFKRGGLVG